MNEDWDDMAFAEPLAGEELERLLARYSRVRLDPSQAQAKRARSAVMEEAWRRRIEATHPVVMARPARPVPFSRWSLRRFGASLTAAVLAGLVLGTSAFGASRAGGPLYEPRLALEELAYPDEPTARLDAQLRSAEERLGEAFVASARHDTNGTRAAVQAYDRTLAEIEGVIGPDADHALLAIQDHHEVLEQIAERAPDAAAAGLDRALANSERVIDKLADAGTGVGPSGSGDGPGSGTSNGQGSGPGGVGVPGGGNGTGTGPEGRPTGTPTGTPDGTPTGTEEPAATPKPASRPTDEPEATPKPTRTPRPTPEPPSTPDPSPPDQAERTPRPRPSAGGPGGGAPGGTEDASSSPRRGDR